MGGRISISNFPPTYGMPLRSIGMHFMTARFQRMLDRRYPAALPPVHNSYATCCFLRGHQWVSHEPPASVPACCAPFDDSVFARKAASLYRGLVCSIFRNKVTASAMSPADSRVRARKYCTSTSSDCAIDGSFKAPRKISIAS